MAIVKGDIIKFIDSKGSDVHYFTTSTTMLRVDEIDENGCVWVLVKDATKKNRIFAWKSLFCLGHKDSAELNTASISEKLTVIN